MRAATPKRRNRLTLSLSLCPGVSRPKTRIHVRLLGPCFKTGRTLPFRQRPTGFGAGRPPRPDGEPPLLLHRRSPPRTCARDDRRRDAPRRAPDGLPRPDGSSGTKGRTTRRTGARPAPRAPPLRPLSPRRSHAGTGPPARPGKGVGRTRGPAVSRSTRERARLPAPEEYERPRSLIISAFPTTISSAFHSLFRVLFTFPSQYFCAIGLVRIFSLGWDQPPVLGLQS